MSDVCTIGGALAVLRLPVGLFCVTHLTGPSQVVLT